MRNSGFKTAVLLLLGVFLTGILPAQEQEELTFVAKKDVPVYTPNAAEGENVSVLYTSDLIVSDADVLYGRLVMEPNGLDEFHLLIYFHDETSKLLVAWAKDFLPLDTKDVFGGDIFIDYPPGRNESIISLPLSFGYPPATITDEMWLPDFYTDVLRGQDRSVLVNMHPEVNIHDDEGTPWYKSPLVNLAHGRAMFYNSAIMLGRGTHLAVRNIQKTDFGYSVDGMVSTSDYRQRGVEVLRGSEFWNAYKPGDAVTLLLHLDGDYLDIYTADSNIHVGTFIKARREFIVQYESLIRTDTCDLTNVQWPKRANGSTDYPPLEGVNLDFRASDKERGELALPIRLRDRQSRSQTTDRLRVREKVDTGSEIVTTLDTGTQVQILETGATETIGEITAPWVKVLSENGFTSWAFSGYLESLVPKVPVAEKPVAENQDSINQETQNLDSTNANPPNPEPENVAAQNPEAENSESPKSGSPVLPFAITGGVILVSGIVTTVVLAKRRKGKTLIR